MLSGHLQSYCKMVCIRWVYCNDNHLRTEGCGFLGVWVQLGAGKLKLCRGKIVQFPLRKCPGRPANAL